MTPTLRGKLLNFDEWIWWKLTNTHQDWQTQNLQIFRSIPFFVKYLENLALSFYEKQIPPTFNANKFLYFYKYLKSLLFNEPLEESALSLSLSLYLNIPQLSSPVQWSAECPGQPGPAGGSLAQCGPSARWTVWQKISAGWKPGELQLPASFLLQSAWQSDQSQWSSGRQLEKAELLRGLTRYNRPEPADIYLYF